MKLRFGILALVAFVALIGFNLLVPGTALAQTRQVFLPPLLR